MLELSENCADSAFCRKLKSFLLLLELSAVGTDALHSLLLRNSATELLTHADDIKKSVKNKDEAEELIWQLEEISKSNKPKSSNGGKTKNFSSINPKIKLYWVKYLEKKRCKI